MNAEAQTMAFELSDLEDLKDIDTTDSLTEINQRLEILFESINGLIEKLKVNRVSERTWAAFFSLYEIVIDTADGGMLSFEGNSLDYEKYTMALLHGLATMLFALNPNELGENRLIHLDFANKATQLAQGIRDLIRNITPESGVGPSVGKRQEEYMMISKRDEFMTPEELERLSIVIIERTRNLNDSVSQMINRLQNKSVSLETIKNFLEMLGLVNLLIKTVEIPVSASQFETYMVALQTALQRIRDALLMGDGEQRDFNRLAIVNHSDKYAQGIGTIISSLIGK